MVEVKHDPGSTHGVGWSRLANLQRGHDMAVTADLDGAGVETFIERSRTSRALRFVPLGVMAVIGFVTYGAIGWTLRRGFDWTDEAFVYTMIASNRMAVGEPWGFQHLLHPLYVLTGQSVLAFRVLRLAGYVLLSVALVWSARVVVRRMGIGIPSFGWVFILLLAQVGTFFAWSYPPRYLGYNELASWFSQLGVALIVLSLAWGLSSPIEPRASRVLTAIWVGMGALTTLLVFAKVTSAVIFGVILVLVLVVPNPHLRLWKRVISLAAGSTAVLLVLWAVQVPIIFYFKNAYSLVFDKSVRDAFGHPAVGMISTYLDSLDFIWRDMLPAVLLFALAMATFRSTRRLGGHRARGRAIDSVTWILGALLAIALIALPRSDVWSYLGALVVFMGVAASIGLAILGVDRATTHRATFRQSLPVVIGGCAIVATPFISALGTSNGITGQFIFAATLWAVLLGIALVLLTQRATLLRSRASALPTLVGCLVMLLASVAVMADIASPYRTVPLLSQDTSTSVPELRGLLLSKGDAAYIDWVAHAGHSLGAAGTPGVVINPGSIRPPFSSFGALFAFNHSGYANPWIGLNWPVAFASLRFACTNDPPSALFVLQPDRSTMHAPSTVGVTKSLAACGIHFPADFRLVDRRRSVDPALGITIWQLKPGVFAAKDKG
jgi:hypothetical protein